MLLMLIDKVIDLCVSTYMTTVINTNITRSSHHEIFDEEEMINEARGRGVECGSSRGMGVAG